MKLVSVEESDKPKFKYVATFEMEDDKIKKTYFGASGYKDYIQYYKELGPKEANKHKLSYQARHLKDLDTKDPSRAGFLSYFILWTKPTLEEAIKHYKKLFKL